MKNLAIISSPSHYYNLLELSEQLGILREEIDLVIFKVANEKISHAFYDNHICPNEWNSLRKINLWNGNDGKLHSFSNIWKVMSYFKFVIIILFQKKYDSLIVNQINANYYRVFYGVCNFNRIFSMDEGNAIIKFIEQRNNTKDNFGWFPLPEEIIFFSSYEIEVKPPDKLITCTYEYSKRILQMKNTDEKLVLFIGSPFVEDNMMDQGTFFEYLQKVSLHYAGYQVVYISHRREVVENLLTISERFHFSTITPEKPAELYFLEMERIPRVISGFYSAAIYNLRKMTPKGLVRFESCYIDPGDIRKDTPDLVRGIYNQFANAGIKIIF
jgi:hypothetical protein